LLTFLLALGSGQRLIADLSRRLSIEASVLPFTMITDEELLVEAKGSAADIAAACSSIKYTIHKELEPWMQDKQFQLSFDIVVKGDDKPVAVGLSLPEGWALIDKSDSIKAVPDTAYEPHDANYSSIIRSEDDPSHRVYHSTLNGLLMHTKPHYKANKENELMDRLMQLAAEKKRDEDD
jgi:hypothetical protein